MTCFTDSLSIYAYSDNDSYIYRKIQECPVHLIAVGVWVFIQDVFYFNV